MSEVSRWLTSLGKSYIAYQKIFEDSGVDDLIALGMLEIADMVSDMGIKRVHAMMIHYRYRRDFCKATKGYLKPSLLKSVQPWSLSSTANEEKVDAGKIALYTRDIGAIFPKTALFEELAQEAKTNNVVFKAMGLLHEELSYIKKLQKKPLPLSFRGFLSHVQKNSADLCRSLYYGLKEKKTAVWIDMAAVRLDSRGMAESLGKPIIVAVEADNRHGGMPINEFTKLIPKPMKFLPKHEFVKIERRKDFWEATINVLSERLNVKTNYERQNEEDEGYPPQAQRIGYNGDIFRIQKQRTLVYPWERKENVNTDYQASRNPKKKPRFLVVKSSESAPPEYPLKYLPRSTRDRLSASTQSATQKIGRISGIKIDEFVESKEVARATIQLPRAYSNINSTVLNIPTAVNAIPRTSAAKAEIPQAKTKRPYKWEVEDVCEWLKSLGSNFEIYTGFFKKAGIDGDMLRYLTMDELEELRVRLYPHRRKILCSIKKLDWS